MLLKIVREGLGRAVAFVDQATRPTPMARPPEVQRRVDIEVRSMALYQYFACPFCIKTRRAIHRLNLPIELRDAQHDPEHRAALAADGGKVQVPCLRIDEGGDTRWLYESTDIIAYLERRFGSDGSDDGTPREAPGGPSPSPGQSADHAGKQARERFRHRAETSPGASRTGSDGTWKAMTPAASGPRTTHPVLSWPTALYCLGAFACAGANAEQAGLHAYQCVENGVKTFSDKPCGRVERRLFLGYSSPKDVEREGKSLAAENAADAQTDAFINRVELKRAIARAEGRVSDLRKQRDAELVELQARLNRDAVIQAVRPGQTTGTHLDPEQLVAAEMADHTLIEEMKVMNTRYAQDIALAEQHLEQLQGHLASMEQTAQQP
ncbi:MAG: glutathione S-transferase N-terminal domain-containing protein [Thiohalocapsa sp.]